MSLRDDIIAQRAIISEVERSLAVIERRVASRNTAYLLGRARGMVKAANTIVSEALSHPVEAAGHADLANALPGRPPVTDAEEAGRLLDGLDGSVVAISHSAARMRLRHLNDEPGNAATTRLMVEAGWRQDGTGFWQRWTLAAGGRR